MDTRDFLAMTLLQTGTVRGRTKLQKLVYFVGLLTDQLDSLGYRPHFYGPYSDDVARAVAQLREMGVVDQNVTDWGYSRQGFEVRRYDFQLSEAGRAYAQQLVRRHDNEARSIRDAVKRYQDAGDQDYMDLSIAAKAYFLLGEKKGVASTNDLAQLAARFGWSVNKDQIVRAAKYLQRLGLVEVDDN